MEYQYPMDVDWTTEEKIAVISFFQAVEKAYEKGIAKQELLDTYKRFKEIVPSKAEEKTHCAAFEKESVFSLSYSENGKRSRRVRHYTYVRKNEPWWARFFIQIVFV